MSEPLARSRAAHDANNGEQNESEPPRALLILGCD